MKYLFLLEETPKGIMNLYENAQKIVGPVPPQYECIYFIVMILFALIICSLFLFPYIIFRRVK